MIEESDLLLRKHIGAVHPYRSILALNGHLPEAAFFEDWKLPVIAADGAINTLLSKKIRPAAVVGDFDSMDLELVRHSLEDIPLIYRPDQNYSDFTKCLNYMEENNLLPSIIVGINGGYIDHILNNINLFLKTDNIFYAPPIVGMVLREGSHRFTVTPNTKVSLLGIPQAIVSSQGLKWELENYQVAFPGTTSCFNRIIENSFSLEVIEGSCLCLIYLEE
jgi:thiamine pyrophosphokinase